MDKANSFNKKPESPPVSGKKETVKRHSNDKAPQKRNIQPTGIKDLDDILDGGVPIGTNILLSGDAGTGKTTLAAQWLSLGYRDYKENGVYITMTEPTTRLIKNLNDKSFFSKEYIASSDLNVENFKTDIASRPGIHFIDLRQIMENIGLLKVKYTYEDIDKLIDVLSELIAVANVQRVVVDSITAISYLINDTHLIRTFIFRLGKILSLTDTNTFLISEARGTEDDVFGVEAFISDGVVRLSYGAPEKNIARTLKIKKLRGVNFNSKPLPYKITADGLLFFPEVKSSMDYPTYDERLKTSIPGFDLITGGGYIKGSTILLAGPSGAGKTIFAMQSLINTLKEGGRAIYFSFEESSNELKKNMKSFGWNLDKYEKEGNLKIISVHPNNFYPQEYINIIQSEILDFSPSIVAIDSLSSIESTYSEDTIHGWVSQLFSIIKQQGVTAIFTSAVDDLIGASSISGNDVSALFNQIIILRYVEIKAEFRHAILVLKMRGSNHDKKMYNLSFTPTGLEVVTSFSGYEGVFSGNARQVSESVENQLSDLFTEILGPMGIQVFTKVKREGLQSASIKETIGTLRKKNILSEDKSQEFLNKALDIFGEKQKTVEKKNK